MHPQAPRTLIAVDGWIRRVRRERSTKRKRRSRGLWPGSRSVEIQLESDLLEGEQGPTGAFEGLGRLHGISNKTPQSPAETPPLESREAVCRAAQLPECVAMPMPQCWA